MMKNMSGSTTQFPALRRIAAGALLCCTVVTSAGPAWAQTEDQAALNFVGADIESVIKAVGHYTGMTFVIDPRVKGTLTLVSEKSISKSQAFALLTSALRLQGYAVVTADGFAKVVPEAEAKLQASPTQVGVRGSRARGDQIATQIYYLNYESAANLTAVLRPLISPNNSIMANPGNNSLVITDYADNLRRLSKIIAALDAPVAAGVDVIPIRNGIASDMAAMVNKLMEPGPGGDSGRVSVVADPRTNSLILRAPSEARARLARSLIAKLDAPTSQAGNVHVVYLKNADATKLAQTLRAVMIRVLVDASAWMKPAPPPPAASPTCWPGDCAPSVLTWLPIMPPCPWPPRPPPARPPPLGMLPPAVPWPGCEAADTSPDTTARRVCASLVASAFFR